MSTEAYVDWPADARGAVERAIERHGGRAAWERLGKLRVAVTAFSGLVGRLKGVGRSFALPARWTVDPRAERVEFADHPRPGFATVYHRGGVSAVGPDGSECAAHPHHRRSFRGLRKLRRWSDIDIAYFVGYTQANYHGFPFTLPAARFVRFDGRAAGGVLTLDFPADADYHGTRQRFHFDPSGLLVRMDYRAEIVGPGPTAAHHCENFVAVGGVLFPSRRRVLGSLFGSVIGPNLLTADFTLAADPTEDRP